MRVLIIEDEVSSQNLLSVIINDYCANLELIGIASDMASGIHLIETTKPDIVFLDIELGNGNAFDLLDSLSKIDFAIIITTAYTDHALKAFQYEAIDYLLKPYSPKDVIKAVGKVKKKVLDQNVLEELRQLIANKGAENKTEKIYLPSSEGFMVFNLNEIISIEADGSYAVLHTLKKPKFIISKTLKDLEELLPENMFSRVHASHLVNLNLIEQYRKEDGGSVIMCNGAKIPLSRRKKGEFLEIISRNLKLAQ